MDGVCVCQKEWEGPDCGNPPSPTKVEILEVSILK